MGYYTSFTISTLPHDVDAEGLYNKQFPEYRFPEERTKWYEHDEDLLALSLAHPTVVFILDGADEEAGDRWRKFYVNGEVEEHKAEWTAPERPLGLAIPEFVPAPEPKRLHVPSDHLLAPALDGKEYTNAEQIDEGLGPNGLSSVIVEGSVLTVPDSWLEDDA